MKKVIPNNETIRHLCHLFGATEYYLLIQDCMPKLVVVANIPSTKEKALAEELSAWCGVDISAISASSKHSSLVAKAIKEGTALHNSALKINLAEE
jgi:hypothetical protein